MDPVLLGISQFPGVFSFSYAIHLHVFYAHWPFSFLPLELSLLALDNTFMGPLYIYGFRAIFSLSAKIGHSTAYEQDEHFNSTCIVENGNLQFTTAINSIA